MESVDPDAKNQSRIVAKVQITSSDIEDCAGWLHIVEYSCCVVIRFEMGSRDVFCQCMYADPRMITGYIDDKIDILAKIDLFPALTGVSTIGVISGEMTSGMNRLAWSAKRSWVKRVESDAYCGIR
jgi:hypothetical protein